MTQTPPALVLVLVVVAAGVVGGVRSAVVTAVGAALALNLAFTLPYGTYKIDAAEDWLALAVFLAVALAVGTLVAAQTDRRRAAEQRERDLRDLNERLQTMTDEAALLAEEATRARVLEQVSRQRSALLRSVSHDLRTPLATIEPSRDLRAGRSSTTTRAPSCSRHVCDETERLDRIVANLLSMSRVEAGALEPERQAVPSRSWSPTACAAWRTLRQGIRVQVDHRPRSAARRW